MSALINLSPMVWHVNGNFLINAGNPCGINDIIDAFYRFLFVLSLEIRSSIRVKSNVNVLLMSSKTRLPLLSPLVF
jgi:hypothetical protein